MPYSVPTQQPVPFPSSQSQPHSQGRTGHRRSFSHITPPETLTSTPTGAFAPMRQPPRRRSASSTPATQSAPPTPVAQRKFHLGRDDDDDDDSPDEARRPTTTTYAHDHLDDEDTGRSLPPLRLKKPLGSSFDAARTHSTRGSPPPQIHLHHPSPSAASSASVPFPCTSDSPLPSPSTSRPSPTIYIPGPTTAGERPNRPSVSRTSSTPILLANGRPLKSSLKSSSSSPNIPFPPQSLVPSIMFPELHPHHHRYHSQAHKHGHGHGHGGHGVHQRAASAPSTPRFDSLPAPIAIAASLSSPDSSSSLSGDASQSPNDPEADYDYPPPSPSPPPQKNVHFPSSEEGGLATVRLFNRSAKPASLSRVGDETETETEGESSAAGSGGGPWGAIGRWRAGGFGGGGGGRSGYPFPQVGGGRGKSPLGAREEEVVHGPKKEVLDVDMGNSSPVPARGAERADGNVYLESLGFASDAEWDTATAPTPTPKRPLTLTGTLLVRNVAYHKAVAVRFTLDDWHTTNEVAARYEKSLSALPPRFIASAAGAPVFTHPSVTPSPAPPVSRPYALDESTVSLGGFPTWDRFRFEVALEDYSRTLEHRTLWLVARFTTTAGLPTIAEGVEGIGGAGGAGGSGGGEWWDNNGGRNYRVGFRKVWVEDKGAAGGEKKGEERAGQVYRRNSAPPVFSPSKPYPAPAQIASSLSFPGSASVSQAQKQHHEALAQSTLARLRKLNLRNYAAPAGYAGLSASSTSSATSPSPASEGHVHGRTTSASSNDGTGSSTSTSAESTPLQTPTQDDEDEANVRVRGLYPKQDVEVNVLGHEVDPQAEEEGMETPRWSTFGGRAAGVVMGMVGGFPATPNPPPASAMNIGNAASKNGASTPEMGSSPPFSALSSSPSTSMRTKSQTSGLYWPWGSFGKRAKEEEPKQEESAEEEELPPPVASLLEDIKEKNTSSTSGSGPVIGAGPIAPPQRKRHSNGPHQHGHGQKTSFILGGGSGSGSSSSGSGSGSDTGTATHHHHDQQNVKPKRGPAQSQTSFGAAMGRMGSPVHSLSSSPHPSLSSPQPTSTAATRALSPIQNLAGLTGAGTGNRSPPYPGSPKRVFAPLPSERERGASSPLRTSPVNSSAALSSMIPVGGSTDSLGSPKQPDDALYQAFVRQWCFAQGPGPLVGATSSNTGTPGPATPGEGPRLVVG